MCVVQEYLQEGDQVDLATFVSHTWPSIKDVYRPSANDESVVEDTGSMESTYDDATKALVEG